MGVSLLSCHREVEVLAIIARSLNTQKGLPEVSPSHLRNTAEIRRLV